MNNEEYKYALRSAAESWKAGRVSEYIEKAAKICIDKGLKPETVNEEVAFGFGCDIDYGYDTDVQNKINELKG